MKKFFLILIVILAAFLRLYKLDQVPASLNWDEVAAGYNAYTIANWGRDEWGRSFPIVFESFRDDKHPVHIYTTSIFVKFFGLSDFVTRLPSAIIGTLSVVAIYFLARRLFSSETAGLFSALFLAVSPYHLQFSRGLWEANFALAFFLAGLVFFYKNIPLSFGLFGLSFFSYHSAKVVIPIVVLVLCLIYFKNLISSKKILIWTACITLLFGLLLVKEPKILGFARINQTNVRNQNFESFIGSCKSYFAYSYLFLKGDGNPRASVKVIGQFYKIDFVLLVVGLLSLIWKRKWKELAILVSWILSSPIAGAISSTVPSATRGIFMIGPIILFSGFGASAIIDFFKKKEIRIFLVVIILFFLGKEVFQYLKYYYSDYAKKEAIEWQYGMKQIVEYLEKNPNYQKVYVDKIRQQPYIFFLYYMKVPLPEFLKTVKYEETEAKSYNTVRSFRKYQFGGWDPIESYPGEGILYVITPSYFTGLRFGDRLEVNKLIKYPDKTDAFYIVSGHEQ